MNDYADMPDRDILREWLIHRILPIVSENGLWMAPDPAPLDAETVEQELRAVMAHPSYRNQTLITRTDDGFLVTAKANDVSVERL